MVGLSVILENCRDHSAKKTYQVISKGSMIKPPSSSASPPSPSGILCKKTLSNLCSNSGFLDSCFLCNQEILPAKDIYMYKGDRAFCSVECRCRHIVIDEEESTATAKKGCTSTREYNCSLAAIKGPQACTPSPPSASRGHKGARNRSNAFAC